MNGDRRPSSRSELTRFELAALVDFLSGALNDPDTLGSSGLTTAEQSAVKRAHNKLLAQTADRSTGVNT